LNPPSLIEARKFTEKEFFEVCMAGESAQAALRFVRCTVSLHDREAMQADAATKTVGSVLAQPHEKSL
jgi:hypothetical protein